MYEYIHGTIAELTPTYAVLDAGGVGYYLHISLETFKALERVTEAKLFVHYIVREDAQLLYGFATRVERELFRLLLGVPGVGGNTARMVLSTYSPSDLQGIIAAGNVTLLKNVKGLGLKTAQKILVELNGKLTAVASDTMVAVSKTDDAVVKEAMEALVMLGFTRAASDKALRAVLHDNPAAPVEELVRQSLKHL